MGVLNNGKTQFSSEKMSRISCFTCHSLYQQHSNTLGNVGDVVLWDAYWVGASSEKTSGPGRDEEIERKKREHGEGASWLTAQRGQRSVPWGYVSLTPPQNETDPLSEITSCRCFQGGKNSGNNMAQQGRRNWSLCQRFAIQSLNKQSGFGCRWTSHSSYVENVHCAGVKSLGHV